MRAPQDRAVFLDRDGTLIEDVGHISNPEQIRLLPQTVPALRRLQTAFALFIVTHQGGIARGLIRTDQAEAVNAALVDRLAAEGIAIQQVFTCPHNRDDGCDCMKPSPRHAIEAAARYGFSLEYSFAVGDHAHDAAMGRAFGGQGIYVLTGHGRKHLPKRGSGYTIVKDIGAAADLILAAPRAPFRCLSLDEAAELVRQGRTVGMPTETVYGLAADAFNADAVVRVFEAKQRPSFDPLIVHISDTAMLDELAAEVPPAARTLAERFWPGPLTLVLPKHAHVPDLVTAGLETVGIRFPAHPVAQALIEASGTPLAAPSANLFGQVSPTRASHVMDQLGRHIGGVMEGGPCRVGVESTIVGFWQGRQLLLRSGGLPLETIEAAIGPIERFSPVNAGDVPAPGTLPRHYAPRTPMQWVDQGNSGKACTGRLLYGYGDAPLPEHAIDLSSSGDLNEAATHLYRAMRELDAMGLELILVDRVPNHDIGLAINDRLARAMHPDR